MPPKKEEEKKATVKDGPGEGEEKPTAEQRLTDAVRDAKLALLKVCGTQVMFVTRPYSRFGPYLKWTHNL